MIIFFIIIILIICLFFPFARFVFFFFFFFFFFVSFFFFFFLLGFLLSFPGVLCYQIAIFSVLPSVIVTFISSFKNKNLVVRLYTMFLINFYVFFPL
eukprot:NODE_887_length_1146_cov_208.536919_g517_i2.p2 GENE.NODE_887_length_1146_cov_208.536919_g517_i2~~NODE_887_length_1146_cov_208.536919_g517_i2.p2  ORF type:complete len:97 (+),score=31.66 NODE_887_length_1146_cov_208.536919_g517_i2:387-677(+)